MLYKGDTLYVDWLEDGIAELVFDAPGSVNKLDTATVASLGQALDVLEKQSDSEYALAVGGAVLQACVKHGVFVHVGHECG